MDSFTMIALLPHGNILALMEAERKKTIRVFNGDCTPFYPLVCPLCFYASGAQNTPTIRDFSALFQSKAQSISVEVPVFEGNTIVCPVTFFDGALTHLPESFLERRLTNRFTLRANRFLYGAFDQESTAHKNIHTKNCGQALNTQRCEPHSLRVFQLCEYECTVNKNTDFDQNCVFEWTAVKSAWVKT